MIIIDLRISVKCPPKDQRQGAAHHYIIAGLYMSLILG